MSRAEGLLAVEILAEYLWYLRVVNPELRFGRLGGGCGGSVGSYVRSSRVVRD